MKKKIYLSPSSQIHNEYAYGGTTEDIQCGKVAESCRTALKRNGFDVKLTQYKTLGEKRIESDAWGADLYVPIHSNAYNGKVTGTRIFSYDSVNNGYKAAKAIFDILAPFTPGTADAMKVNKILYEIRAPKASTAFIEIDFHDVPDVAKWIMEHTDEIGEKIAEGICNFYGVKFIPKTIAKKESAPIIVEPLKAITLKPYIVRVTTSALNIREGAGTTYKIVGCIKNKGAYTIVGESAGWGKLKSGAGWISLQYTKKI